MKHTLQEAMKEAENNEKRKGIFASNDERAKNWNTWTVLELQAQNTTRWRTETRFYSHQTSPLMILMQLCIINICSIRVGHFILQMEHHSKRIYEYSQIQSNLNSSNTDGSFTMTNSNLFLSVDEILLIDPKYKYLRKVS